MYLSCYPARWLLCGTRIGSEPNARWFGPFFSAIIESQGRKFPVPQVPRSRGKAEDVYLMLKASIVHQIRQLLDEKRLSQRKIAGEMGVSRTTVQAIAQGRHARDRRESLDEDSAFQEPAGPLQRCPTCGGLVYMPCLLCHVRRLQQKQKARRRFANHAGAAVQGPNPAPTLFSGESTSGPASVVLTSAGR